MRLTVWGENLTNRYCQEQSLTEPFFGVLVQDAPPRMYGFTFTYDESKPR